MENRRKVTILMFALIVAFALVACGGSGGGAGGDEGNYDSYAPEEGFYDGENAKLTENAIPEGRKVIRNADLEIMAQDAPGLYQNIAGYTAKIGGYEHSYSITNYEAYAVIHAVLKVPPEKLNTFVHFVGENGNVVNSSMSSEDITENYFDAVTRLDTKRRSLEQYYQLLRNASSIEDIVYIQRIIDEITEDIESLEGRLNLWNSQVNMATVNLYIRQNNDPVQIRQEINWNTLSTEDMGYLIKRGFFSVTNTIMSILQWLVVILIGYSPVWIILGLGVFIWIKMRKRIQAKITSIWGKKNE
jgi:uncharacterized lipoprotein YehR (DUF1307 family)